MVNIFLKCFLFVCLFVLGFIVPIEKFSLIWRKAANFDLCSAIMAMVHEGSLACPTYCDTGRPFIMVISEDPCDPLASSLNL